MHYKGVQSPCCKQDCKVYSAFLSSKIHQLMTIVSSQQWWSSCWTTRWLVVLLFLTNRWGICLCSRVESPSTRQSLFFCYRHYYEILRVDISQITWSRLHSLGFTQWPWTQLHNYLIIHRNVWNDYTTVVKIQRKQGIMFYSKHLSGFFIIE